MIDPYIYCLVRLIIPMVLYVSTNPRVSLIQRPKLQRKYLLNAGVLSRSVVTLLTTMPLTQLCSVKVKTPGLGGSASLLTCVVYRQQFEGSAPADQ